MPTGGSSGAEAGVWPRGAGAAPSGTDRVASSNPATGAVVVNFFLFRSILHRSRPFFEIFGLEWERALAIAGRLTPSLKRKLTAGSRWAYELLRARGNSIEGGTSEVQLGVIAKRILGLPS